jgi:hypothetical protein
MHIYSHLFRCALVLVTACLANTLLAHRALANELIAIENAGFEEAGPDGLEGWSTHTDAAHGSRAAGVATKAEFKQDLENFKEGKASALILHEGPRWATFRQNVTLENGAHYRLRAFAKTDVLPPNSVRLSVRLSRVNEHREEVIKPMENTEYPNSNEDLLADGEWHEFTREFTIPDTFAGDEGASIQLRAIIRNPTGDPVSIWFDDVSLERIESNH